MMFSQQENWDGPKWPDARGWVGIGVFGISVMLLWMLKDPSLRQDEFFQTIATVIISNGLMAVVAWAYSATKGGGELADKNAAIVRAVVPEPPNPDKPQIVQIEQPGGEPVPVTETAPPTDGGDAPWTK